MGSLHSSTQLESVLAWDCLNPCRYCLVINNTHPLIGDRLQRLNQIARNWSLEELNLPFSPSPPRPLTPSFFLQSALLFGFALGIALGVLSWLVGAIGILLGIYQLAWMYSDWQIIRGCIPIGFSIGTIIRLNSLFPNIKPSTMQTNTPVRAAQRNAASLPHLLANPITLPISSQSVCLQGKLLGRQGISNWLGQDLLLHSSTGLIKLHHTSLLGFISYLFPSQSTRPCDLVEQQISVTGWFRRGATPWIDTAVLRTKFGKTSSSAHLVWSILLAGVTVVWGAYMIAWGGA